MQLFRKEKIVIIRRKKVKKSVVLIILFLLLVFILKYIFKAYIPYIKMKCHTESNRYLNDIINKAVQKELSNINYDSLVDVKYDSNGNVKAVLCDTVKMSLLKHNVSQNIIDLFKKNNCFRIRVPLVYISSNPLIANIGPKVSVKVEPSGLINVDFNSTFTNAGINQTKHEINIIVKTKCYTYLAGMNSDTEVKTAIPVAHTVIVGEVPETYTNVESTEEGLKDDVLNLQ